MLKKKVPPLLPEGVFGVTSDSTKKPAVKRSYVPNLRIQYDKLAKPPEATDLDMSNVVPVSERLLKSIQRKVEYRTEALSQLLLQGSIPSVLACEAASDYASAVLEDGFGFSATIDSTVQDALSDLVRLEAISFFIRRSKLLKSQKQLLLSTLTTKFADRIIETIQSSLTTKKADDRLKTLEAVVALSSKNRTETFTKEEAGTKPAPTSRGSVRTRRD